MRRPKTSSRRLRFRHATLCLTFLAVCAAPAFAQAAQRVVAVDNVAFPNFPVEIVGVDIAGRSHAFAAGKPGELLASFAAGEDWPQQLALRIRNRSGKAILSVSLSGSLGTGVEGEVPMHIGALYGQEMDESAYTGQAPRGEPRRLAPGETAEVRWSADEYERMIRALSERRPLSAYRKMRIELRVARFEDGTVWSSGSLYRIDPTDPRKWTLVEGTPPAAVEPSPAPPALKPGERIVEDISARAAASADAQTLAVTEIRVNGQSVTPGQPFAAGADWLRSLTVRVKNVSAKPIDLAQLNFTFPEARYRDGGIGFTFRYGEPRPGRGGEVAFDSQPLMPGEEAELSFARGDYEAKLRFAEKFGGVSDITRVRMGTASVIFADGTRALVATPVRAQ